MLMNPLSSIHHVPSSSLVQQIAAAVISTTTTTTTTTQLALHASSLTAITSSSTQLSATVGKTQPEEGSEEQQMKKHRRHDGSGSCPPAASSDGAKARNGPFSISYREQTMVLMATAMAFHFGGYEFIRNSCLALFTSDEYGFTSSAAFPLANGLISPFSLVLLWWYGQQLDTHGPRIALQNSTVLSIVIIGASSLLLFAFQELHCVPPIVAKALVGFIFLFQNSYQYLVYMQQWSFCTSVATPSEGTLWFSRMAGLSSLVSTVTGAAVPYLLPHVGLLGLLATTCLTLTVTLLCQDRAYGLASEHGFDPTAQQNMKAEQAGIKEDAGSLGNQNRFDKAVRLFRRVPTLGALFVEVLSFQSLNSILNVAFIRALKANVPDDLARTAYTGRFYSLVSGCSALMQFIVLPPFLKRIEPSFSWSSMPWIPFVLFLVQELRTDESLLLIAVAFFIVKTLDYSLRSVLYAMVYQPLDFESRFVGKEIIGVFGSRFGKSGMSLLLSGLTSVLGEQYFGFRQLLHCCVVASSAWITSTWWLRGLLPPKEEAQRIVEQRQREEEEAAAATTTTEDAGANEEKQKDD